MARFAGQPIRRKAEPGDQTKGAEEAQGAEVSEPGEPAEQEADAVADHVADKLHGDDKKGGEKEGDAEAKEGGDEAKGEEAGQEKAPEIGAKLEGVGRKVFLAGKNPLRGEKKDQMGAGPEANAMHVGNAAQAGIKKTPQHHCFPQNDKDKAWFKARGVDVDNYCVNVDQARHEAIHTMGWNEKIMTALKDAEKAKKGKKLTEPEMVAILKPIMATFKIDKLPFVKYGSEPPQAGP